MRAIISLLVALLVLGSDRRFRPSGTWSGDRADRRIRPSVHRHRPYPLHGRGRRLRVRPRRPRALARAAELCGHDGGGVPARRRRGRACPTSSSGSDSARWRSARSRPGAGRCRWAPRWRWSARLRSFTATPMAPRCRQNAGGLEFALGFVAATALLAPVGHRRRAGPRQARGTLRPAPWPGSPAWPLRLAASACSRAGSSPETRRAFSPIAPARPRCGPKTSHKSVQTKTGRSGPISSAKRPIEKIRTEQTMADIIAELDKEQHEALAAARQSSRFHPRRHRQGVGEGSRRRKRASPGL